MVQSPDYIQRMIVRWSPTNLSYLRRCFLTSSRNEPITGLSYWEEQAITRSMNAERSASGTNTTSSLHSFLEPSGRMATPSPASTSAMTPEDTVAVEPILGEN